MAKQTTEQRQRIFAVFLEVAKKLSTLAQEFVGGSKDPRTLTDETAVVFIASASNVEDPSKGVHNAIIVGDNEGLRDAFVRAFEREENLAEVVADALEVWVQKLEARQKETGNQGEALANALKDLFGGKGHIIIGGFGGGKGKSDDEDLSGLPPVLQEIIKKARQGRRRG